MMMRRERMVMMSKQNEKPAPTDCNKSHHSAERKRYPSEIVSYSYSLSP